MTIDPVTGLPIGGDPTGGGASPQIDPVTGLPWQPQLVGLRDFRGLVAFQVFLVRQVDCLTYGEAGFLVWEAGFLVWEAGFLGQVAVLHRVRCKERLTLIK